MGIMMHRTITRNSN